MATDYASVSASASGSLRVTWLMREAAAAAAAAEAEASAVATTTRRKVRRQPLHRIIGKEGSRRFEQRKTVFDRTGIVVDSDLRYMFKWRGHVPQHGIETDVIVSSFERTVVDVFSGATTIAEAGKGECCEDIDGLKFGTRYGATFQQIRNCEHYAGVVAWFTGSMGGHNIGASALVGKNADGVIVALICGFSE